MTQRQAFFLTAEKGQRFCIFTPSLLQPSRGALLYLHPFAEELNKSRRMVALQIAALALAGFDVLQIDLLGCGDSSGDFEDATWANWVADGKLGLEWLQANSDAPLWLWGLRCGALLAMDIARQHELETSLLLWQPVFSGANVVRDFMRLAVAGELASGNGKQKTAEMRALLKAGQAVEVAGYGLSAAMADQIASVTLAGDSSKNNWPKRVGWLEVGNGFQASPAAMALLGRNQAEGSLAIHRAVPGAPFWQTSEIETVPELISETATLLTEFENA